jgi:ligand-binding sensor domain-containing protein
MKNRSHFLNLQTMKTTTFASLIVFCALLSLSRLQAQQFTNYTTDNGLPSNVVNGVAVDSQNNKWFATQSGVAKFDGSVWTVFTTANGIIDNYINCIAVDVNDRIWAGTDIGVSTFNGTVWVSYTTANGLANSMINYIAGDLDGSVWIGTSAGLSHFDGTNWTNYTTVQGLANDFVSYIAIEDQQKRWFGTMLGGLSRYNGSAFATFTRADSLTDDNILSMTVDASKNKWIGTVNGITKMDINDAWVRNYRVADGLFSNFAKDLDTDSKGNLWVGMFDEYLQEGGVAKFSGGKFTNLGTADGLVSSYVKRIAVDQNDEIWIATGNGVSRLVDTNIGIDDATAKPFSVYPNPASGSVNIEVPTTPATLFIYDLPGNTIMKRELKKKITAVELDKLIPGVYLIKTTSAVVTYTGKLIVR